MIKAMLIGGEVSGVVIQVKALLKEIKIAKPPNVATLQADKPVLNYKENVERYILKQLPTGEYVYLKEGLQYQHTYSVLLKELEILRSQIKATEGTLIGNF